MKHLMKRAWTKYALAALVTVMIVAPTAAIAGHNFSDVPSTHLFHGDIEWMLDNGITTGCGAARYCPESNVTRGHMAAFMKRLSTSQVVDAKTAVTAGTATLATTATNATKLGGKSSSAVMSAVATAHWDYLDALSTSNTTPTTLASVTVTAPAAGFMLIQIDGQMWHDMDSTVATARTDSYQLGLCTTANSSAACDGTYLEHYTQDADNSNGTNDTTSVSKVRLVPVTAAGSYTFYLNGQPASATDALWIWDIYATAIYIPAELASTASPAGVGTGTGQ